MAKYFVMVHEIHISMREVKADTPKKALDLVADGDGIEVHCEWSHALPASTWSVEDPEGNEVITPNDVVCDITG